MDPPPIPPYLPDPPDEPIFKWFYFEPHRRSMTWQPTKDVLIMCEPSTRRFSCAVVESTTITPSTVLLPTRVQPKKTKISSLRRRLRLAKQFFESINPKNDFKSNEDLEEYLYQRSLEIQPKGVDAPTSEVKPKHPASTLRSPGIKPPKTGNHYAANHPIGLHLHTQLSQPAHHSSTVPNTPVTAHETKRSFSHTQEDSQSALYDVRYDRSQGKGNRSESTQQKIPVLQPPPLVPRVRNQHVNSNSLPPTTQAPMPPTPKSSVMMSTASSPTSTSTTPSSALGPAPKLHPRRHPPPMSPLAKSPLTPSNDNSPSAFQFPIVYDAPPPLPPRPSTSASTPEASSTSPSTSTSAKENQEQLQVIFDREESHSPTVRLSVPLPPALPPPRGSSVFRAPPPLPPKTIRQNSGSPTSSDPFEDPTSPSIFVNTTPPPLPPKTYRSSRMTEK